MNSRGYFSEIEMRDPSLIALVELAHRLDLSDEEWLDALAQLAHTTLGNTRAPTRAALFYSGSDGARIVQHSYSKDDPEFVDAVTRLELPRHRWMRAIDRDVTRCDAASDLAGSLTLPRAACGSILGRFLGKWNVRDVLNLQGASFSGYSVGIAIGQREECTLDGRSRRTWERVCSHLGAGVRVRQAAWSLDPNDNVLDRAQAVFDMKGRELHVEKERRGKSPRSNVQAAANAVVRARTREGREDPEHALEEWRALFDGEFSIVEAHDTDSKAFLVAVHNEPDISASRNLTGRERQVVSLAAKGESDCLIAYELGLNESTVRTHLRRALMKTGFATRVGLIRGARIILGRAADD